MPLSKQAQDNLNDILAGIDAQVALLIGYVTTIVTSTVTDATQSAKVVADVTAKFNAWGPKFKDAVTTETNEVDTNEDLTADLLA